MTGKVFLNKAGQVSIEILLLAGIIIMMTVSVFSYYTQIRDSTLAMQLIKIKVLKTIDELEEDYVLEEIAYKLGAPPGGRTKFCVSTSPEGQELPDSLLHELEDSINEKTVFDNVNVHNNLGPCTGG